jgi:vitamin B12 transporter
MVRKIYSSALLLTAALLVPQSVTFADSLKGVISDPQGRAVPDAQVRLFDRNTGEFRGTTSSSEGGYAFDGIPSGDYLLEADASSAALTASRNLTVNGEQSVDLNLRISPANTEVLVLASGTPLTLQEVSKAVDVIDAEEIELRDEIYITDTIRTLPGIRVQTNEGPGSFTTIKTRGLRNQDTAVLIDGMRFRDAASLAGDATAFLEDLTTTNTQRIEFLRGSGSTLYGSNAVGGVINITSRSGGGPRHGVFRLEGGGLGMVRTVVGIGGGISEDRFTYSGSASHTNVTKGPRDGTPYRNTTTQGSAKYSFTPGLSLTGRVWFSDNYLAATESATYTAAMVAGLPAGVPVKAVPLSMDQLERFEAKQSISFNRANFIPNQIDPDARRLGRMFVGSTILQHQVTPDTSYRIAYQGVTTRRTSLDGPAGTGPFEPSPPSRNRFNGYIGTLQARLDQRAGRHQLITAGYEFESEKYINFSGLDYSSTAFGSIDLRQRSHALYIQDQVRLLDDRLQVTLAGRRQSFDLRQPVFAGSVDPSYTTVSAIEPPTAYTADGSIAYFFSGTGTKIRSHVGSGFRAPSGYERFGGGGGVNFGDPRLNSDRTLAVDAGVDQWFMDSKVQATATLFYTKLQQIIRFGSVPANDPFGRPFGGYTNGGSGIARGVELSAHISPVSTTKFSMSYTFTNSDSNSPTITGTNYSRSLGVSDHAFTLTATQWFGNRTSIAFDMSALSNYTFVLFGRSPDFGSQPFIFNGPTKADVVIHHDLPFGSDRTADLYVKVENIFNQRAYEGGFIGPKAWAIAGLSFKF